MRYRVELPKIQNGEGKFTKPQCLVLRDVYIRDDDRPGTSVTVFSPVIVKDGYLDISSFTQVDWLKSLDKGQVKALINRGIIIIENDDGTSVSSTPVKKGSKGSEVNAASVHVEVLEKGPQAKVERGLVEVLSKFNALSFNDKKTFIKECKEVAELEKIIKEDSPNKYFMGMLNKRIKDLSAK